MSTRPPHNQPKSLMRNLGEFFGHIAHGVKSQPQGGIPQNPVAGPSTTQARRAPMPPAKVVREHVQEQEIQTPDGKMVLRRRIIDEVQPPRP